MNSIAIYHSSHENCANIQSINGKKSEEQFYLIKREPSQKSDKKSRFAVLNLHFPTWVSLIVVGVDSPASNVTGVWRDKTKDQIDSFSCRLIAQWEPKVFCFFLL